MIQYQITFRPPKKLITRWYPLNLQNLLNYRTTSQPSIKLSLCRWRCCGGRLELTPSCVAVEDLSSLSCAFSCSQHARINGSNDTHSPKMFIPLVKWCLISYTLTLAPPHLQVPKASRNLWIVWRQQWAIVSQLRHVCFSRFFICVISFGLLRSISFHTPLIFSPPFSSSYSHSKGILFSARRHVVIRLKRFNDSFFYIGKL